MIDFELGWRAVPGFFSPEDGDMLQRAVLRAEPGTAVVELGAWCGRSLAAACEVLPAGVQIFSVDNYREDAQTVPHACGMTSAVAEAMRKLVAEHYRKATLIWSESSAFGRAYEGPPVSVLFIDDHHSYEHVQENLKSWVPRMAQKAAILFHDYKNESYGIEKAARETLPLATFLFAGLCSGVGVWVRA